MKKNLSLKKYTQSVAALLIIVFVAAAGYHVLISSHAESPYGNVYVADGTLKSPAALVAGGSNSKGDAVKFTAAVVTPSPSPSTSPSPSASPSPTPSSTTGCTSGSAVAPCIGAISGTGASGWGTPILNDTFADDNNTLNTKLWTPYWYGNGDAQPANCASTESSNVSMGGGTLNLKVTSGNVCGLVTTNPDDGAPGHTGFQVSPDNGNVYVEYKAYLPPVSSTNAETANWPALWMVGQPCWPQNGEIDVMEGLSGHDGTHLQWGSVCDENTGGEGVITGTDSGTHTFGVLWTTSSITTYYDGVQVWTTSYASSAAEKAAATAPEDLIMEDSAGSYGGPTVFPSTVNVYYARVWQQ
jgi:hypothetical protein